MIESSASFSDDRRYRYTLTRRWGTGKSLVVIGLNPSTADERMDDPTIRRCIGFAKREGLDALVMLNLFAFRATAPAAMKAEPCPVAHPDDRHANDRAIVFAAVDAGRIVAAWGVHGAHLGRDGEVRRNLLAPREHRLFALGFTRDGHPRHPLYLRSDTPLVEWSATA